MPVLLTAQPTFPYHYLINSSYTIIISKNRTLGFLSQIYTFLSLLYFIKWSHNLLSRSRQKQFLLYVLLHSTTSNPFCKSHRLYLKHTGIICLYHHHHHLQNNRFLVGHRSSLLLLLSPIKSTLHRAAKIEIRSFHSDLQWLRITLTKI